MIVSCPTSGCEGKIDVDDVDAPWTAAENRRLSIGALVCPNCHQKNDFHLWRTDTTGKETLDASDQFTKVVSSEDDK